MPQPQRPDGLPDLTALGSRHPALRLVVLFGSRTRGEARHDSDWDLGYRAEDGLDAGVLLADLMRAVGTDRLDLSDLDRAGALLRYRASRDGVPLYQRAPGEFDEFWLAAVRFWCDAEPVLRRDYEELLRGLAP